MQIVGRHYATAQPIAITFEGERITKVEPATQHQDALPWIGPGFVDLQINGFGGHEFNEAGLSVEQVRDIVLAQDQFGVTRFCPTTTTQSLERLEAAMNTLAAACNRYPEVNQRVAGIHLEGPFISPEDGPRGAHPLEHCQPPDWNAFERLQRASGNRIRIVTMSAEYDAAPTFIARAVQQGVRVAIGHTNANTEQIARTVAAGASFSTHLGNAAHPRIRRHPNYIWDQLADDRLAATLIVDGHHLPPAVVKSFVRAKTAARCVLVSDITGMAGMPPGNYSGTPLGNIEVLEDGRLVVAGQREMLAGASRPIGDGVSNVMRFAGVSLATAVDMASIQAAELIGVAPTRLEPDSLADLVLFDLGTCEGRLRESRADELVVRATIKRGKVVYGAIQDN